MKVPDSMIFAIFKEQDARIREKILDKGLEISTGKKYMRISEDVWATYNILNLKEDISRLSQHSKNRLFADMNMSYIDSVLGNIEDILKSLYTKGIQAKNGTNTPDQLKAISEFFSDSLNLILSKANEKLGNNYIFSGTKLDTEPFDENFNYRGSNESFKVWIAEKQLTDVFIPGSEVFNINSVISSSTYSSYQDPLSSLGFTGSGTITITYNANTYNINYTDADTLEDIVNRINNNTNGEVKAFITENADGTYSIRITGTDIKGNLTVTDSTGGAFGSFDQESIFTVINRLKEKMSNGYYPDDSDIFVMQRSYDHIALKRSEVGSRLASVRSEETAQINKDLSLRKQKSDIEDADLSESVTEYTRYRLAYEALMRIINDQKEMTILKYI